MTQQTDDKSAALDELYKRITRIAAEIRGVANLTIVPISVDSIRVAAPRSVDVPALHVEMPNGFRVEFTPTSPLNIPFILSVRIRQTHHGYLKSSSNLNLRENDWYATHAPLSDDEIRALLTPDELPPAIY